MEPNPPLTFQPKPREKYKEFDRIARRVKYEPNVFLLLLDGRQLRNEILAIDRYNFLLTNKTRLEKLLCIGAIPHGIESLLLSTSHPTHPVPAAPSERFNQPKLQELYPEHRLGCRLRVILVNGWELSGTLEDAGQFYLTLRLTETQSVCLYRHALADYDWPDGPPPPPTPEELQRTEQQRKDLFIPAIYKKKPAKPQAPPKPLWEVLQEEVTRTTMNAKLKFVLKEAPKTVRQVGDIFWIPLQNQPAGLPKDLPLDAMSIDLIIPKKTWLNAQKKAAELKKQTGHQAIQIIEANIGMYQNRFAAVSTNIQVVEGKPKAPSQP